MPHPPTSLQVVSFRKNDEVCTGWTYGIEDGWVRDRDWMKAAGKNVTLADVARSAGVAPMTVSRFLNKHPSISEKAGEKVRAAIKKLNYAPNLAARVLAGQTSHAIGVVVPNLTDPFYAELVHHVQSAARHRGVLVWIGASESDTDSDAALIERMNQQVWTASSWCLPPERIPSIRKPSSSARCHGPAIATRRNRYGAHRQSQGSV